MRKGKRFTPARLSAWEERGRGTGFGSHYLPWHQVTRGDPGSRGRSHLINWRLGRLHHLLSDHELLIMGFSAMEPGLVDIREQFPLSLSPHPQELSLVKGEEFGRIVPGTLELADTIGVRHPRLGAVKNKDWWVMSTDLLLTISQGSSTQLVAISIKYDNELASVRTRELLQLEREYWRRQGVPWLLITPSTYSLEVGLTVRHALPWALVPDVFPSLVLQRVAELGAKLHGGTFDRALLSISTAFNCTRSDAQFLLWGAVWAGVLPVDLSMRMDPNAIVRVIPSSDFWSMNPIASRRSAWQW
jgi:hypothetical protein